MKGGKHYQQGKIQAWDYIIDQGMGYLEGNVVKYLTRYRHKGTPAEDLQKAKHYLEKLIEIQTKRGWK